MRSERRSNGIADVPGAPDIVLQWRWNVCHRALRYRHLKIIIQCLLRLPHFEAEDKETHGRRLASPPPATPGGFHTKTLVIAGRF